MSTDMLPFVFPDDTPRARRSDPLTSHEAADTNDIAGSRSAVLQVLTASQKPLADHEIEMAHRLYVYRPYTSSRLRTARHELVTDGLIESSGTTRTPSGRRTQTWTLVHSTEGTRP
jgi:hypothetical protein